MRLSGPIPKQMRMNAMTKLEQLIQELCPHGVEYPAIGEVTGYEQPSKYIVKTTNYKNEFDIPVLTAGQSFILGYIDETDGVYQASKENPVIIFDDFTGAFKWVDFPFKVKSSAMKMLKAKPEKITLRYLFYVMEHIGFTSSSHSRLWISKYSKFQIPLPPLEVQQEIVRILDHFTGLTAALTSELTARQKQYEYYRNQLLTFEADTRFQKLGDTCKMKAGKTISSTQISTQHTEKTPYPCFGGNGMRGYVTTASHYGEFPIIGRQGALCGNVNYATGDFYATEHAVVVESNGEYLQRFLYYLLVSMNLNQYQSKGAQPGLAVKTLENLVAPVPPLEEQQRIVAILDRFDTLCNDLSAGLPAEIRARQKQYEYYRDKLLSFAPQEQRTQVF